MIYRPSNPLGILTFDTTDVFGKRIILEKDRFENHILNGHIELTGNEEAIKDILKNPYMVLQSKQSETRYLYYGKSPKSTYSNLTIKTVVDHKYNDLGFVVTSMFQKQVTPEKEGKTIYVKEKTDTSEP